jgi:hypothetical protein
MTQPRFIGAPPSGRTAAPDGTATDGTAQNEAARVRLGASVTTPADVLLKLALDPSVTVRTALVLNPAAPPASLTVLARDADERVRALLAGKLAVLAPCLTETEQSRLNQQAVEALRHLIQDTAVRVRAAIAEVVKEMPDAPRDLVLRFARDAAIEVSEPVIRLSPLLTAADLLSLLATSSAPEVALAVARRPGLAADVADVVAGTADTAAIRAMLLNHSAQIRESTLDALIARAAGQIPWHMPLVRRPNLSPRAAQALSHIVAETLLAELASRVDLVPAVTVELRARLSVRLRVAGAPRHFGATPGVDAAHADNAPHADNALPADSLARSNVPARSACVAGAAVDTGAAHVAGAAIATGAACITGTAIVTRATVTRTASATPSAPPTPMEALAEAGMRAAAGRLTEADLLGVASRGEVSLAAAMLAVAASVPQAVVERAATLRSAKGVVSLAWRAGFSMKVAVALQSLLGRLAPGSLLTSGPGGSFPLAAEEMRWQIEFLSRGVPPAQPAQPASPVQSASPSQSASPAKPAAPVTAG